MDAPETGATAPLLDAVGLRKTYGNVEALRGASLTVMPHEIVALIGDNGAGKSTLIRMLSGVDRPDSGLLSFEGRPVDFRSPNDARDAGIETVYQELSLANDLDSSANMFLGRELLVAGWRRLFGVLDKKRMRERTQQLVADFGVKIKDIDAPMSTLSGGQRQGLAVVRSVAWPRKLVMLDEPTAALGVEQTQNVLDLVRRVRDQGISVVLITHNMPQVLEVADRVEVLRLGRRVARFRAADVGVSDLVAAMTGALVTEEENS